MSSITILKAVPLRPITKTISAKTLTTGTMEYVIGQYDQNITFFSGEEVPLSNFEDLAKTLDKLVKDKYSCVIRGAIKQGVLKDQFKRRKSSNPVEGAIEDVDQNWVCLDLDSVPLVALGCTLEEAPAALRSMLPTCFAEARCWWNFSASQGFKSSGGVSVHMWFWLDDETSNAELKRYFTVFNESCKEIYGLDRLVDTVMFDSIQIHYTAPPDLVEVFDPLKVRHGILDGKPTVRLTEDWIKSSQLDTNAITRHLERIGDDKDGFHSPILSASASWVRSYGSTEKTNVEFKLLVRDYVARANKDGHNQEQMDRYTSDSFLDQLLKSAAVKGFDKNAVVIDANAAEMFKGYVYVESVHKFFKLKSSDWTSVGAFDQVSRKLLHMSGGSKIFIDAGGEIVDNVLSVPGSDPMQVIIHEGKRIYNKWRGRTAMLLDTYECQRWEDHIAFLCDGRVDVTEALLDYFAFIISKPGEKVNWSPIIGSEFGGIGKSIIKMPMRAIFNNGCTEIGTEDIRNPFNGYMESELIFVEEIYGPDNRQMVNQIKAKLTETTVRINIKGIPQYDAPNFANFVMFTNHRVPFPMDPGDRRFMMVFSDSKPKLQEYYDELAAWLKEHVNDIYTWACRRNLSKFNQFRAPLLTEEKQVVIASSQGVLNQKLVAARDDMTWPFQFDVVNLHSLIAAINQGQKWQVTPTLMIQELKKVGAVKYDREVRTPSGARLPIWIVRDFSKYQRMNPKDIMDMVTTQQIGDERSYYLNNSM